MIGFLFTLTFTSTLAAANAPIVATCVFGQEAFLGFVGTVNLNIDVDLQQVSIQGQVNDNPKNNWKANQAHNVQIRSVSDISAQCMNVGDVFVDLGDFDTDDNSNLQLNLLNDDWSKGAKAGKANQLVGRTLVINRNSSADIIAAVDAGNAAKNVVVACCVITDVDKSDVVVYTAAQTPPATTAPATTNGAWPYNWPQEWVPPPNCQYIPPEYQTYVATTKATTTTTYYGYTTTTTTAATTTAYDPYAPPPPPPPPPPPATQYNGYYYTTTTKATTTAPPQYCWNCPVPQYGVPPPASAYYQVACPCIPSYYVKCPASTTMLAALAALVAFAALLF